MALNLEVIGEKTDPTPFTYTEDTIILYALGIGAGTHELDFVYEKNLKVFPTFAVIPIGPVVDDLWSRVNFNWTKVLHGEQQIILHKEIPTSGTLYCTAWVESIHDKGDKGAPVTAVIETRDEYGTLLFENRLLVIDRSGGNFGGDRGPKAEKIVPPEGKDPDFSVSVRTSRDQALLYRLSGDKNPLHADPDFAGKGGLPKPILHGLCTYGIAGKAILRSVCGNDPARFKSFSARFLNPVFPGETLTTQGWKVGDGTYVIQVRADDGRFVLGNARARII